MGILFFVALFNFCLAGTVDDIDPIRKPQIPVIAGEILKISGRIDSHIYDFLSWPNPDMKGIRVVELNSFGGNSTWGLQIAKKLMAMKITTRVAAGDVCASACVYLFAAGVQRKLAANGWLGIHGAHMTEAGFLTNFDGLCFVDLETERLFMPQKKGCQEFMDHWFQLADQQTRSAFHFMESQGVSPALFEDYMKKPDEEDWIKNYNIFKKEDWPLDAKTALHYNLATCIER